MLFLFLRQKLLMARNSVSREFMIRRLPFIALGIGFWVLLYIGTFKVLSFLRAIDIFGEILAERLLSLVLFSITGFLMLSTVITSLSSFYLSRDVPFLLTNPIETRDILRLKSFESIVLSSWMVTAFTLPVFMAYGASYHAPVIYYGLSFFAFMLLVLIAAGTGITAAHLLTRVFPARRSRQFLLLLGLVLFLAFYFLIKTAIPGDPGSPGGFVRTFTAIRTDSPFLPGYWVMKTVFPVLKDRTPDIFYLMLLISNSAFFLLLAQASGQRFYRRNIDRVQPSGSGQGRLSARSYPGTGSAVFFKDIRFFFRDAGQWSQIFIIGALILVYTYNFRSIPIDAIMDLSPFARGIIVLINLLMSGLVLTAVAARFLFTSVSLEGRAFWVVKTAPLSAGKFLWSKFLYGFIPLTAIVMTMVSLTNYMLKVDGPLLILSEGTALLLSFSVCALGAGLGAAWPKFEYDNIASVSIGMGAMTFMLIAFGLVVATLSVSAWGYYLYAESMRSGGLHAAGDIMIALCFLSVFFINAAAFLVAMKTGIRRLRTMEF